MSIRQAKVIIESGLIWANWTDEQKIGMEKALQTIKRYENIIKEAEKLYDNRLTLEEFGGNVTNIINNDVNSFKRK